MNGTRWLSAGLAITGRPIRPGWSRSVMRSIQPAPADAATPVRHWRPCSSALPASRRCANVVRVTISPDNVASYQLASQYGFTRPGEQRDDEDGLEIIYEAGA